MKYRAKFDNNPALAQFAETLEQACVSTVEEGHMTKDLALLIGKNQKWLTTEEFMGEIVGNLDKRI